MGSQYLRQHLEVPSVPAHRQHRRRDARVHRSLCCSGQVKSNSFKRMAIWPLAVHVVTKYKKLCCCSSSARRAVSVEILSTAAQLPLFQDNLGEPVPER